MPVVAALALAWMSVPGAAAAAPPVPGSGPVVGEDRGTRSAIAPVTVSGLDGGRQSAHTYSAAEARALERTGGDPAVLAYWTASRMAAARPLDLPTDASYVERTARAMAREAATSALPTREAPSTTPSSGPRAAKAPAPVTNFSVTNGKLFLGGYESGSWCSASAVNTSSRRVLITAGHCVHSGKGGTWRSNIVFVPGYNAFADDHDPVGRFQAYRLRTFDSWISDSDLNRDVGFVTTYSGGDRDVPVVDAVGGHGLAVNGETTFDASVFGYPSNRSGGERMSVCRRVATDSSSSDDKSAISCGFGPGASGGPWLWKYDNATGQGQVRSVTSTVDGLGVNRGPYFDTAVREALNLANSDWPDPA